MVGKSLTPLWVEAPSSEVMFRIPEAELTYVRLKGRHNLHS